MNFPQTKRQERCSEVNWTLLLGRLTSLCIVLEMAPGGLLTFGFISSGAYIVVGFTVYAVSIATLLLVFPNSYSPKFLKNMAIGMVVLLTLQILLGFATLTSGNRILAFFHILPAIAILGLAVSETFVANIAYEHVNASPANGS